MKLDEIFKEAIRDRGFLVVWLILLLGIILFVVLISLRIAPSDLQIPIRYSSFGVTNFYRDKWYYLLAFVAIGIVLLVAHTLVGLKLYARRGRELAIPFMWLGVGLMIIMYFIVFALFGVIADIT